MVRRARDWMGTVVVASAERESGTVALPYAQRVASVGPDPRRSCSPRSPSTRRGDRGRRRRRGGGRCRRGPPAPAHAAALADLLVAVFASRGARWRSPGTRPRTRRVLAPA